MRRPPALLLLVPLLWIGCAESPPSDRYLQWSATPQAAGVAQYQQFLDSKGLGEVTPMGSLLRSARTWRACKADEFAVPPRAL